MFFFYLLILIIMPYPTLQVLNEGCANLTFFGFAAEKYAYIVNCKPGGLMY